MNTSYRNLCLIAAGNLPFAGHITANSAFLIQYNGDRFLNHRSDLLPVIDELVFTCDIILIDRLLCHLIARIPSIPVRGYYRPAVHIHIHFMDANLVLLPSLRKTRVEDQVILTCLVVIIGRIMSR
ncbi:hypothetical protein D3C81_1273360 [compost metagenome]